jgi:hypothetical protein
MSYKYDDAYFVILPFNPKQTLIDKYSSLEKFSEEEFSSKTFIMQRNAIKEMLKKGNFI